MAALSIRNLDDRVRDRLRVRAAANGRSMEAEARTILAEAVGGQRNEPDLFCSLLARFDAEGGIELEIPSRDDRPRAANFEQ